MSQCHSGERSHLRTQATQETHQMKSSQQWARLDSIHELRTETKGKGSHKVAPEKDTRGKGRTGLRGSVRRPPCRAHTADPASRPQPRLMGPRLGARGPSGYGGRAASRVDRPVRTSQPSAGRRPRPEAATLTFPLSLGASRGVGRDRYGLVRPVPPGRACPVLGIALCLRTAHPPGRAPRPLHRRALRSQSPDPRPKARSSQPATH